MTIQDFIEAPVWSPVVDGMLSVATDKEFTAVCRSPLVEDWDEDYAQVIAALGDSSELVLRYEEDNDDMYFGRCEVSVYRLEDWWSRRDIILSLS